MKFGFCLIALAALLHNASAAEEPKLLTRVTALPVVLDSAFQFRKTKIFALTEKARAVKGKVTNAATSSKSSSVVQEASIIFERQYRLFGAVTGLDQRQRFGDYFDGGRVTAWRCLLIENGRIVAENRSFLWE